MQIQANGLTFSIEDTGPSGCIPIVLLHGFPFTRAMWNPQWEALKGSFRLIRYDQRGHGQTGPGDGQYPLEFLVDDLAAILDHLGVKKAVLCGLSMGGYVALRFAEREPQRLAGLALCDTRSETDSNKTKLSRANTIKLIKEKGISAFCEGFLKSAFSAHTLTNAPQTVDFIRAMILTQPPNAVCATLMALAGRTDTSEALAGIRVPVLVMTGEQDAITPPADGKKLAKAIPGAEWMPISNAGHISNVENKELFTKTLKSFISNFYLDLCK